MIEKVAESAATTREHSLLGVDLVYLLRDVASQALDSEAWRIFRDAVGALAAIGTSPDPETMEVTSRPFEEASRAVGWLGESAACATLPTKPMMYDYETDDPLEAIGEGLARLSNWAERGPGIEDWAIIIEANGCFADRLLEHQREHEHLETHLIHACGKIARLGE